MKNIILIARNVLKLAFKKKGNIIVYFVLPVLCVLFSMAMYSHAGIGSAIIGIQDNDKSILSTDMIKSMRSSDNFKLVNMNAKDVKSNIISRKVDCVLIIPNNFENDIKKGKSVKLDILSIKGESATSWIKSYTNFYMGNLINMSKASSGSNEIFNKIYQGFKSQDGKLSVQKIRDKYMGEAITQQGLGLCLMFIMLGSILTVSFILKEKENRTYYRIFCAPVNSSIYILGNVLANMIIMCVQVITIIFTMRYILNIDTNIPNIELFIILMDFSLVSIGYGMIIVAFSKSRNQANGIATLIITPTCMLSGCFWPMSIMPDLLRKIANFIPQTWVMDAISKGQGSEGFTGIYIDLIIILAFAVAFFVISIYKLKINNNVSNLA